MIKILIVDDHRIFREGLKRIISPHSDIVVHGEASNSNEALDKLADKSYDVMLLDISMPGISGLDLLKQLRVEYPELKVLILTMHPEEQFAVRALKLGASGYLSKDSTPDELVDAVRKASWGGKYITVSLAEKLALILDESVEKPPHEKLTDREYQIMCLLSSGKTGKDIAEKLYISINTVSSHRDNILKKMNMKNDAELTFYAVKNGLVS